MKFQLITDFVRPREVWATSYVHHLRYCSVYLVPLSLMLWCKLNHNLRIKLLVRHVSTDDGLLELRDLGHFLGHLRCCSTHIFTYSSPAGRRKVSNITVFLIYQVVSWSCFNRLWVFVRPMGSMTLFRSSYQTLIGTPLFTRVYARLRLQKEQMF